MSDINDGGPAFPVSPEESRGKVSSVHGGMTLRDYLAAKAMQGLIASNDDGAGDRLTDVPAYAYDIADAMLKARQA